MSMAKPGYCFQLSNWDKYHTEISKIRDSVFVQELGLPHSAITQENDADCYHVLAFDGDGETIGTGSLNANGEISHIAVLKPWRGRTVGKAILIYLLQIARTLRLTGVWVDAFEKQTRFYKSKDFQMTDKTDQIDGIQIRRLIREFEASKTLH